MDQKVRTMLEQLFLIFIDKYPDPLNAWDKLIEFIAIDNHSPLFSELDYNFQWFYQNKEFIESVMSIYDSNLLKDDYYDHLGEMFYDKIVSKGLVESTNDYLINQDKAQLLIPQKLRNTHIPNTVFDPAVGSGRLLMAVYQVSPKAILCGVDSDIRLLRIAYTNLLIHNIPGYLLHADESKHETDISTREGMYNWRYYNKWHSCMNKLLPKCKNVTTKIQ